LDNQRYGGLECRDPSSSFGIVVDMEVFLVYINVGMECREVDILFAKVASGMSHISELASLINMSAGRRLDVV
jgi:hypothetical protein